MITFLFPDFKQFPDIEKADENGLLAVGGNLHPQTLLRAYAQGIFPWFNEDDPICWFAPAERCVIFPERIKVSKSMKQLLRKATFSFSCNLDFDAVMAHCAQVNRPGQDGTWITEEMQTAYQALHRMGCALSIEVWQQNKLVGGLYGVLQGKIFCGESMFSLVPNASKAALIHLCTQFNFRLIDCQVENPHLISMGAEIISRQQFSDLLSRHGSSV